MQDEELKLENARLKKELQFFKEYDLLTGLYNKNTFYQKTRARITEKPEEEFYIYCVDIEKFKLVNDLYGSEKGDELLQYLAEKLREKFSPLEAVLGRISADIYGICIPASVDRGWVELKITEIFADYRSDIRVTPAIGAYEVSDRTLPVELMCDRAILALNTVKGNYMKHSALYDSSFRNLLLEEHEILSRADEALKNGEFKIYMQPKCNMRDGKIVGAEALVRWEHPQRGLIAPCVFIPVFEKNGFIKKLDIYMWEEAAKWLSKRKERGEKILPVSVNVSRIDILGMDVFEIFYQIVQKYDISPDMLEVEVTESAYTGRPEKIIATIEQLMHYGFTVLMDDFGSGYSSLNILKDINIDILKLDMRFLDSTNQKSRDILVSVVHMARWLKLKVIAEGVETKEQVDFLLGIGCVYAQGYYYYHPMPLGEIEKLLEDDKKIGYTPGADRHSEEMERFDFREVLQADMMTDQLLDNILGAIALYQYDGEHLELTRCNDHYCRIVHYDGIQASGESYNLFETVLEEDRQVLVRGLEKARNSGDSGVELHVRRFRSDGRILWLQIRFFYLAATNKKDLYYASVSDVTGQMEAIEELRVSEQRFRIAMEDTSNTLFEVDTETHTAYYAQHSRDAFGLSDCVADAPEGFIEQGSVCEGYEDMFRQIYYDIYAGAKQASCTIRAHMGDGSTVWNRITLTAIKDNRGKTVRAIGLVENVTREKELELKLNDGKTAGQS